MLGLRSSTDPAWVEAAEGDLDRLLSDHAHCELKAAQSALSVLARFGGEHPVLVDPLVALATEETEHFHQVQARLSSRGGQMQPPDVDGYARDLLAAAKATPPRMPTLLDRLLVCSLIEARSCERFRLLSEGLRSGELRSFYRELMESEARHYRLFRRLAEQCFGVEDARSRFEALAACEASIAARLPLGPTVHG